MGINYKGSQCQTERAVVLQEEEYCPLVHHKSKTGHPVI
jgi:hypothetical protein